MGGGGNAVHENTEFRVDIKASKARGDAEVATGFTFVDRSHSANCEHKDAKCIFMMEMCQSDNIVKPATCTNGVDGENL